MLCNLKGIDDMYTVDGRVTFSQSRGDGNMSLPSMMYFMQDSVNLHCRDIGRGLEYLDEKRRLWAIIGWNMKINRRPAAGEEIIAGTYSSSLKSMLATRVFIIQTPDGEVLAEANSLWIYMDMDTRKPARITEEDVEGFERGEPLADLDKPKHKLDMPDVPFADMGQVPILRHFLDVNGHLNNISYIFLAMEYLPKEYEIKKLTAVYKKETYMGDIVNAHMAQTDEGYYVDFIDDEGESRFQVFFGQE